MKTFRQWKENKEMSQKRNRLVIYDFDGTIANVPERPNGWSGKDWWGNKQSLTTPEEGGFYDGGVNPEVIASFHKDKSDSNTQTIVLTGRRGIIAPYVRNVLKANNLFGKRMFADNSDKTKYGNDQHPRENDVDAHEEYFVGDFNSHPNFPKIHGKKGLVPDGSTFAHKKFVIEKKVYDNDGYDTIEIWDDRKDHIDLFKSVGRELIKNGKVKQFIIHQVFPPMPGVPATVIHIPVTASTTW